MATALEKQHTTAFQTATYEPLFWQDNPSKLVGKLGVDRRYLTQRPGEEYAERSHIIADMGSRVANSLLSQKHWLAENVNRILVSTSYPYGESPSQQIAQKIGATNAKSHDYYGACPGSSLALHDLYEQRNKLEMGERIMVIASEQYSPTVDGINYFMFGDGSSGCAITWGVDFKILGSKVVTSKDVMGLIKMPKVMKHPYPPQTRWVVEIPESESPYVEMKNRDVLDFLKRTSDLDLGVPHPIDLAEKVIEEAGYDFSDINVFACHQSSGPALDILEEFAREKGFRGRFPRTVKNYGNTSSATIFGACHYANLEEQFPAKTKICFMSFGAGLTIASSLVEIN